MSNMPRIYTDPMQSEVTVDLVADMDTLEEKLTNMPDVATEEEAEVVSEYRAQFRKKARELDKQRLAMTEGARSTVKMINDGFNTIIERAKRCTQLADNKLLPYMRKKEEERRRQEAEEAARRAEEEEARRLAEEAQREAERIAKETKDAEALQEANKEVEDARQALDDLQRNKPAAKPIEKTTEGVLGSKTGMRKVWKYRLVDINKVPEDFLVPPEERLHKGALNAVAKRDQDKAVVPGIEFYYEEILTSREGVK